MDAWNNDVVKSGEAKENARLLTKEELIDDLGFGIALGLSYYRASISEFTPEFIYNRGGYWIQNGNEDQSDSALYVSSYGDVSSLGVSKRRYVRPVVTIYKKYIKELDYKQGDKIKYKDHYYYVLRNSTKNDTFLTLIMSDAMSDDEILKYDNNYEQTITYDGKIPRSIGEFKKYYNDSEIKVLINNWIESQNIQNDLEEVDGYKARLLSIEELKSDFGYSISQSDNSISYRLGRSGQEVWWLINYDYWVMNMDGEIYQMDLVNSMITEDGKYNLRPVINLQKSAEISRIVDDNDDLTLEEIVKSDNYDVGDIIRYKEMDFYILEKKDKKTTLLKLTPLSVSQINKYENIVNKRVNNIFYPQQCNNKACAMENDYGLVQFYSSDTCHDIGTKDVTGCSNKYEKSDVKKVLDKWVLDYFDKSYLELDENGSYARLLNDNDLIEKLNIEYQEAITNRTYKLQFKGDNSIEFSSCWASIPGDDNALVIQLNKSKVHFISVYKLGSICPVITLIDKENTPEDDNIVVDVPDTLSKLPIVITVVGVMMITIGGVIYFKKKKQ